MYDVPRRKELRDRCAEPWKRKGGGSRVRWRPSLPPGVCRYPSLLPSRNMREFIAPCASCEFAGSGNEYLG